MSVTGIRGGRAVINRSENRGKHEQFHGENTLKNHLRSKALKVTEDCIDINRNHQTKQEYNGQADR